MEQSKEPFYLASTLDFVVEISSILIGRTSVFAVKNLILDNNKQDTPCDTPPFIDRYRVSWQGKGIRCLYFPYTPRLHRVHATRQPIVPSQELALQSCPETEYSFR